MMHTLLQHGGIHLNDMQIAKHPHSYLGTEKSRSKFTYAEYNLFAA